MTREEEIMHKAGSIVDGMVSNNVPSEICDSYYQGFIEGAKWAENSPQEVKLILVSEKISESIVNEFMNILNFTYDKTEKCMATKIYNTDLTSLKNIIESKL